MGRAVKSKLPPARILRRPKRKPKLVFKPSTAADAAEDNPRVIANQLRALQRDVKAGFERMDVRFETIIEKILVVVDDLSHRVTSLERRVTALETAG